MGKITPISEKELIRAINEEGLGAGHPYESEVCMQEDDDIDRHIQLPGTIGTTRSGNDMWWLCYTVDENGKMGRFSTHETPEEAYGMALRRYREAAKAPGYVKPEGDSFRYGPVSAYRNGTQGQYAEYLARRIPEAEAEMAARKAAAKERKKAAAKARKAAKKAEKISA